LDFLIVVFRTEGPAMSITPSNALGSKLTTDFFTILAAAVYSPKPGVPRKWQYWR
jgi:hypothetical protein